MVIIQILTAALILAKLLHLAQLSWVVVFAPLLIHVVVWTLLVFVAVSLGGKLTFKRRT